jgi:hypothetical protein
MRFVLHARESALRMPRYTLLKIQQIVEQLMAGTMWLTTHRCVKMASIPIIRAASVGVTSPLHSYSTGKGGQIDDRKDRLRVLCGNSPRIEEQGGAVDNKKLIHLLGRLGGALIGVKNMDELEALREKITEQRHEMVND